MKLLTFGFLMFVFFSVFANCAAPIELALIINESEPGKVVLEYTEFSAVDNIDKPEGFVYRAKRSNDEWVDIHQFEIVDVEGVDEYLLLLKNACRQVNGLTLYHSDVMNMLAAVQITVQ